MTMMIKTILFMVAFAFSAVAVAGDAAAGKEKAKVCAACHGEGGVGVSAMQDFPKLAGQNADYIVRAPASRRWRSRSKPYSAFGRPQKPDDASGFFIAYAAVLVLPRNSQRSLIRQDGHSGFLALQT
jgi:cytochrome c553